MCVDLDSSKNRSHNSLNRFCFHNETEQSRCLGTGRGRNTSSNFKITG
ncbi:hypothetical protein X975_08239, partial [Stegodyphus mimosarum]